MIVEPLDYVDCNRTGLVWFEFPMTLSARMIIGEV
jgi:hypothetical protein